MANSITGRKNDHLRIALEEAVEPTGVPGDAFSHVQLIHRALPNLNFEDIDTSVTFLNKRFAFPLLVGSMTGGTEQGRVINERVAKACQICGIGMSVGSQRVMLERPNTQETFTIRDVAPDILLIGNIGAIQLNKGVDTDQVRSLAKNIDADAVVLHLNAAQEAIQEGGDLCFDGLLDKIIQVANDLDIPCGVKEVGAGFSIQDVRSFTAGTLDFIESAGSGGTSWTLIEGKRASTAEGQNLGSLFADWGIPSVTSLLSCVRYGANTPVIASGGIRSGLDGARALALGAQMTAMALPVLKAAQNSVEATVQVLKEFEQGLKIAMFLTGAKTISDLSKVPIRVAPQLFPEVFEGHRPAGQYWNRNAPLLEDLT